jgi:hypothetical protein
VSSMDDAVVPVVALGVGLAAVAAIRSTWSP